jgi:hypothetical protein
MEAFEPKQMNELSDRDADTTGFLQDSCGAFLQIIQGRMVFSQMCNLSQQLTQECLFFMQETPLLL